MSHVDPFNALGGFSVGIPPELVIDENGNLVNNVNAPNANVTANRVYSNAYFWANGVPFVPNATASGSNTQVQFNNNGNFGASSSFTFNSSTNLLTVTNLNTTSANLGSVANLRIAGGNNGFFLQTDGTGNLTWAAATSNGGNGNPGGANTQVQFNDGGLFAGDAGFTYDKVTNTLNTGNINANYITLTWDVTANVVLANYLYGDGSNITNVNAVSASVANSVAGANVTGQVGFAAVANSVAGANVTGQVGFAAVANSVAGANVTGQVANALVAGTVYTNAQPNITSVGTLTNLTVSGNANLGNSVVANYFTGNLWGLANLARTVTLNAQPNITSVGTLTTLTVSGNTNLGNVNSTNVVASSVTTATLLSTGNIVTNANIFANAGTVRANALFGNITYGLQPNITQVGNLSGLTVVGVTNLGNAGNVKITGGTNGYVLSTDGTGNLTWVAQSNGGGNGNATPGGSNTQIQFNDDGVFGGSSKLFWNKLTDFLYVGGNASVANNINALNVNSTNVNASGNIVAGNINGGNLVTANFISGTLTTNSQANINYLGNVGWLNVDTSVPNSNGNITFNGSMSGTGVGSNIVITGNLTAGNYVLAPILIGNLATGVQPNITSVGNLSSLTVVGNSNLGNVSNITISGGSNGYVLSTNGSGGLSWIPQTGGNGGATPPAGNNTQIQYNNNGAFGADANFSWNAPSKYLFVGGNANINGYVNVQVLTSNVATGTPPLYVESTTPVANLGVETAGTVRNAAQPNITSLGTLTSLSVSGNTVSGNLSVLNTFSAANITVPGTIGTTNLNVTGTANLANTNIIGSNTLTINGKLNTANASNVNLGNIANIHISGGINGYVLATDGAGNLFWSAGGGGGNGNPGGSNTQVQYNKNGAFAGSGFFTYNEATNNVQIAGNLIANSLTMGAGIYQFSQANVYFATTSSDSPNQPILSIDADGVAAVDYTIISTESAGNIRNLVKVSTVIYGNIVNYVEYSTLPVNGYIGDFTVSYDAGSITDPPTIQLRLSPQTANSMVHKVMVTRYND